MLIAIIKPHMAPQLQDIDDSLHTMQAIVGGNIEVTPLDTDESILIVCNEEGKIHGLPLNRRVGSDIIVGDFFVCGQNSDEFDSLSPDQINHVLDRFSRIEF